MLQNSFILALLLFTSLAVAETPVNTEVVKSVNVESEKILPENEVDDLETDASHWRAYRAYPHWGGGGQNYYGGGWNRPGFNGGGGWGNQGWGRPQYGGYGQHGYGGHHQGYGYGGYGGYQGGYHWG